VGKSGPVLSGRRRDEPLEAALKVRLVRESCGQSDIRDLAACPQL
jgi:hypothetical protein